MSQKRTGPTPEELIKINAWKEESLQKFNAWYQEHSVLIESSTVVQNKAEKNVAYAGLSFGFK